MRRQRTLKWIDKMDGDACRSMLVCREIKKAKNKDEQAGRADVSEHMTAAEGVKMLVSTMMTRHDDGNHTDETIEMAMRKVSRAYLYDEARS